jgi:phosphoserine phosphatase
MSHVLVLTTDPAAPALDDAVVARARAALLEQAAPIWLAPGEACEIACAGARIDEVRAALAGAPVDANLVPAANRRKRVLVADMESTLIENEMLDDLATTVGIGAEVADITRRTMNGELDFRDSVRERVALLAGLPVERMEEAATRIRLMPGAATFIATMRAHGAYTAIVSGGFKVFTVEVRALLGMDEDQANDLEIAAGALTGEVREPVLGRDAKETALLRIAAARGLSADDALTVGDGANDLAMLARAGLGVAFRAKPAVAAQVPVRIMHGDLTALLFLQGYRRDEFAAR